MNNEKVDCLYVIAAGNGTRLGNEGVPKALTLINGEPNLVNIVRTIGHHYRSIIVSIQDKHKSAFEDVIKMYDLSNVTLKCIKSGMGSGDAVLRTLINESLETLENSDADLTSKIPTIAHMCWGDVHFVNDKIVRSLISTENEINHHNVMLESIGRPDEFDVHPANSVLTIPVIYERFPYLSLRPHTRKIKYPNTEFMSIVEADFSQSEDGWHDQSIFSVSWALAEFMYDMRMAIWDSYNNMYATPSGEFSFMDIIRYLKNRGVPAVSYEVDSECKTYGFNTKIEVTYIEHALYC